jgi:glycosyltransferase 2 family protein
VSQPPEQTGAKAYSRGRRGTRECVAGCSAAVRARIQALRARIPWRRWSELSGQRRFRLGLNLTVLLLVLLFLGYGVYTHWGELQQYEWTADVRYLLLAVGAYGLPFAAVLLAWHRVMAGIGAMSDLRINARIFCYSNLPKRIPGVVWYIASRAHLYKEEGVARSVTVLGTLLETVLLIVSGLLVYLASLLFPGATRMAGHLKPGIALLLLVPLLLLLHPALFKRIFGYLLRKLRYEGEVALRVRTTAGLLLLYCLAWILGGGVLYLLAHGVHPVPLPLLPAVIGVWAASGAVSFIASFLIQGMGVTEVTLAVLLSGYLPLPVAIVISILFRLLLTLCEVAWALLVAWGLSGFCGLPSRAARGHPPILPPDS